MNPRLCFLAGFAVALAISCGGGGDAQPLATVAAVAVAPASVAVAAAPLLQPGAGVPLVLAFEELWEPRTPATGVYGVVTTHLLQATPDGADPQQPWAANAVRGKWGTLRTLDGSVPGLPDVTGLGPNPSWWIEGERLHFHAAPAVAPTGQSTGGFALISRATFARDRRIVVEATLQLTQGTHSAFAGLALIAGEGDYRELAIQRQVSGPDHLDLVMPLQGRTLAAVARGAAVTLRIEYDPAEGLRYLVNGTVVGTEALSHQGASFAADPHVGLYFVAHDTVPDSFAEGFVGPVRVWTAPAQNNQGVT